MKGAGTDSPLFEFLSSFCYDDYYFPMDGDFQNYTYFPRASLDEVRACWKKTVRLMRHGRAPKDIGIYLHWPFCASRCRFCFCSMAVPRSRRETAATLRALHREIEGLRDIFVGVPFTSLWIGGGTPTFMPDADLDGLLESVRGSFTFAPDAQIYLESSPATLTESKADILERHGVNRLTLGVQSLDAKVLAAAERRGQTRAVVERAFVLARERGMLVDMDLMFGLEGQSRVSFVRDLVWALKKKPDVLHVFAFDPKPQTVRSRKTSDPNDLHTLMEIADRLVRGGGYRMSRLDPKTLKPDCPEERQDSAVRRQGASVLGLGMSAISHAFGSAWYCHPLMARGGRSGTAGNIPAYHLMKSGVEEEMRGYALRNLSLFGRMSISDFRARFGTEPMRVRGLAGALRDLKTSGHLRIDRRAVTYARRDPIERGVALKRLYSPSLLRAIMRGRGRAYEAFKKRRNGDGWPVEIRAKADARALFRVYFR